MRIQSLIISAMLGLAVAYAQDEPTLDKILNNVQDKEKIEQLKKDEQAKREQELRDAAAKERQAEADEKATKQLTFEQDYQKYSAIKMFVCPKCNGTSICQACNGTGKVKAVVHWTFGMAHQDATCVRCNGTGKCEWCKGTGKVNLATYKLLTENH